MNHSATDSESGAFEGWPLVSRGDSKEVRLRPDGRVAIRLLPTLYSYTHNRAGVVPGTERERFRAARALTSVVRAAGVPHAYEQFDDAAQLIVAQRVGEPPPIEVVVKGRHVGTPKHRYFGFDRYPLRDGSPPIAPGERYPAPYVRFDWRNPLQAPDGTRLADETLPDALADLFIDVAAARVTALRAWAALTERLAAVDVELVDICFFIDASGTLMFGELSPDCARLTAAGQPLDKDLWRHGFAGDSVLAAWRMLNDRLEAP